MTNFWNTLSKPFLALAPMENVTDFAFRETVLDIARPDVLFTEFTNVDGICSRGFEAMGNRLKFSEKEHPIVAQIWGTKPENFLKAAQIIRELGFDGIDINMGCPDRAVVKVGGGSALIGKNELVSQIIEATRKGAGGLPISVKTRLGTNKIITEDWIGFLLTQRLDVISIHGRVAKQMSSGEANWEEIGKAVNLRNQIAPETLIVGNGDIVSFEQALEMHKKYGVDGVMIGRGIFANPWVFEKVIPAKTHTQDECVKLLIKHLELNNQVWEETKNFEPMKKFFKMYINGFPGAKEFRLKLMETGSSDEVKKLLLAQ